MELTIPDLVWQAIPHVRSCVYLARNITNGRIYVGMTTRTLRTRVHGHRADVKRSRCDSAFIKALSKHGFESFQWTVLFRSPLASDLYAAEKRFILMYGGMLSRLGYNATLGGNGVTGHVRSAAAIAATADANRGRVNSTESIEKMRSIALKRSRSHYRSRRSPVRCVTTSQEFGSIAEAVLKTGASRSSVKHNLSGKTHLTSGGLKFEYL